MDKLFSQKILYDSMTGTYSRVAYEKQMEKLNFKHQCTIAMIDLNNLKQLNDWYGHSSGDVATCSATAAVLKQKSRHMKLYRYGGDDIYKAITHADEMMYRNKAIIKEEEAVELD